MWLRLSVATLPALFLLWLFQRWDRKRPEPPGAVRAVCLWGALTTLPAIGIELALTAGLGKGITEANGQFVNAFVVAAMTEESLKLAVILFYLWKKPHFDEVMDGILYTAAASLGFALIENVLYSAGQLGVGLLRAFTAVPLHATCSGIMGYFVGRAKFAKSNFGTFLWIVIGWCIGVGIHGIYDWTAMSGGGFGELSPDPLRTFGGILAIVLVFGIILRLLVAHALRLDDQMLGSHPRPLPLGGPPIPAYVGGYPQPNNPYAPPYAYPPPPTNAYPAAYPQQPYGYPPPPPPYGPPPTAYGQPPGYQPTQEQQPQPQQPPPAHPGWPPRDPNAR